MCHEEYCQKCLKPCVENEVRHDHSRSCCSKFIGLIKLMGSFEKDDSATPLEYLKASLVFIFGNHFMYTLKYYNFFRKSKIVDNECVASFFTYMNLFTNILYCIVFNIAFIEFFFSLFFPAILIPFYFKFITLNWLIVLDFEVDESPITELTVRGRGYGMY